MAAVLIAAGIAFDGGAVAAGTALRLLALAPADVALYLKVMRTTALRLRQPSAEDKATAARAEAAQERQRKAYGEFASSHANGVVPTGDEIAALKASDPSAEDRQAIARTNTLHLQPDILVARDLGVDEQRYSRIRDTVERIVPAPDKEEDEDEDRRSRQPEEKAPVRPAGAQELMDEKVNQHNTAALKPHRAEIRKLLRQVGRKRDVD